MKSRRSGSAPTPSDRSRDPTPQLAARYRRQLILSSTLLALWIALLAWIAFSPD